MDNSGWLLNITLQKLSEKTQSPCFYQIYNLIQVIVTIHGNASLVTLIEDMRISFIKFLLKSICQNDIMIHR